MAIYAPPLTGTDGWVASPYTWTYASGAGTNVGTFTISGVDLTGIFQAGDRIKFTQTTVKYAIITAVSFSTNTTVTIYMGTDYTIANAAISNNYYSKVKTPQGFNVSPEKWTETFTSTSTAALTNAAWANTGSLLLSVPVGSWKLSFNAIGSAARNTGTGAGIQFALSESTTSVTSGYESTISFISNGASAASQPFNVSGSSFSTIDKTYTTPTTVYIVQNGVLTSGNLVSQNGSIHFIRATCNYL